MQAATSCHIPSPSIPLNTRGRTYLPPCSPSSSGRVVGRRLIARAGKDGKDSKSKHTDDKADFSARWALRIKNFFSSRRSYLLQAERVDEDAEDKAFQEEIAREEAKLQKQREEFMEARVAELQQQEELGDLREGMVAGDIARARFDLQTSPLARIALALVRVRELLRALLMLPFTTAGAAFGAWQGLFSTQRYENFLMGEGERIWAWRNRTENERWFWEVFVWDRLLFPILAIVCYEFLVPNHFLWAVVAPFGLLAWLSGRLPTPDTPEFWLLSYFGFYRKCWPGLASWLTHNLVPLLAW
ncbi:hypothetical protein Agub_g5131 [Astrephomene gubernaculifera]|uniref:Uncharacterized protein n=1 Tax=Astrephomene gubernaculifera TaxID=47775 RepID=A0AAD3HKJ1_9CHLO|nr:hypothetical protein Agub_g5131 [Astrephomene gubernaculifera]